MTSKVSTVINKIWIKQISGGGKNQIKQNCLVCFLKVECLLYKKITYDGDNDL